MRWLCWVWLAWTLAGAQTASAAGPRRRVEPVTPPILFESIAGQSSSASPFTAHLRTGQVDLLRDGFRIGDGVRVRFLGGNRNVVPEAVGPVAAHANYFVGIRPAPLAHRREPVPACALHAAVSGNRRRLSRDRWVARVRLRGRSGCGFVADCARRSRRRPPVCRRRRRSGRARRHADAPSAPSCRVSGRGRRPPIRGRVVSHHVRSRPHRARTLRSPSSSGHQSVAGVLDLRRRRLRRRLR